jgi:hypothetical protein
MYVFSYYKTHNLKIHIDIKSVICRHKNIYYQDLQNNYIDKEMRKTDNNNNCGILECYYMYFGRKVPNFGGACFFRLKEEKQGNKKEK